MNSLISVWFLSLWGFPQKVDKSVSYNNVIRFDVLVKYFLENCIIDSRLN
jgi:hypothetical protein